ncbi:MAG: hypothetical protein ACFCD0_30475 [Gemmataceae bacterium]
MAQTKTATPDVEDVRPYLQGVAKYLVERLYGPDGPPWGTTLSDIRDVLLDLRQILCEDMLQRLLNKQAQSEQPKPQVYRQCPCCHDEVDPDEPQTRILDTRVGVAEWDERKTYCRRCRRAFFPSVQESGD